MKKQATLLTTIVLIPGATTFTTSTQVWSFIYAAFFGIIQDPSGIPYVVTKLLPIILGWTFSHFQKYLWNIHTYCTTNPKDCYRKPWFSDFCHVGVIFSTNNPFLTLITKVGSFIQIQLKVVNKTSKNIMRSVCPSQILPLCINHNVLTVLLWHTNLWSFCSHWLIFNFLPMSLQIWKPLLPNKVIQVIIWLDIRNFLSYFVYCLYPLLPWHPKVRRVSCSNYIFNIIYLPLQ